MQYYFVELCGKYIVYDDNARIVKRGLTIKQARDLAKKRGVKGVKACYLYVLGKSIGLIR